MKLREEMCHAFFSDVHSSSTQKQHFSQTMSNSHSQIDFVLTGHLMTGPTTVFK